MFSFHGETGVSYRGIRPRCLAGMRKCESDQFAEEADEKFMRLKFIPLEVKFLKIPDVDFDGHD